MGYDGRKHLKRVKIPGLRLPLYTLQVIFHLAGSANLCFFSFLTTLRNAFHQNAQVRTSLADQSKLLIIEGLAIFQGALPYAG